MLSILQISDAHLSPRNTLFRDNVARIRTMAEALPLDLVVATGDLSLDGADSEEDLAFAAALHREFPAPLLALPGNHDIGSHAHTMPQQPVDQRRLERFERIFGEGHGFVDLPGWRIMGLNSEIMGTDCAAEARQADFVTAAASDLGDRRIALFMHKPVFVTEIDDPAFDYWSVPPHARITLAPLIEHPGLRLIASGHLHLYRQFKQGQVSFAWAPPLSFIVGEREQTGLPGERLTGALLHRLHPDHVETVLLTSEQMEAPCISDIRHLTYNKEG